MGGGRPQPRFLLRTSFCIRARMISMASEQDLVFPSASASKCPQKTSFETRWWSPTRPGRRGQPGLKPFAAETAGRRVRFIGSPRPSSPETGRLHFALAEVSALTSEGRNAALGAAVVSLDSIEAPDSLAARQSYRRLVSRGRDDE